MFKNFYREIGTPFFFKSLPVSVTSIDWLIDFNGQGIAFVVCFIVSVLQFFKQNDWAQIRIFLHTVLSSSNNFQTGLSNP